MRDQAGQLGESGEYRMGRSESAPHDIQSTEGGSPRLCRLRAASVGPLQQALTIYWRIWAIWVPANLIALTVIELDDTSQMVRRDSVRATHRLPSEVFTWKTALGRGRTGPDSLIVIAKGGHSCCLRGSRVSCCQVIFPCKVTIDLNLHDILRYGEACFLSSNVEHEMMRQLHWELLDDVDYFCSYGWML
jgi:hypothetical protein